QVFAGDNRVEGPSSDGNSRLDRGARLAFRLLCRAKHLGGACLALRSKAAAGDNGHRFSGTEQNVSRESGIHRTDSDLAAAEGDDRRGESCGLYIFLRAHDTADSYLGANLKMAIRRGDLRHVRANLAVNQLELGLLLARIVLGDDH